MARHSLAGMVRRSRAGMGRLAMMVRRNSAAMVRLGMGLRSLAGMDRPGTVRRNRVAMDRPGTMARRAATGAAVEMYDGQGSFDAGGPCRVGVPTVMYGAKAGIWPTGTDFVPISQLETEARVLASLILTLLA